MFPHDNYVSQDCKEFIHRCLVKNPEQRIGSESDDELIAHKWFATIDVKKLTHFELLPPIIPEINSETDVDNFNTKYTQERPKMTLMNDEILNELKKYDPMFTGFYYDEITNNYEENNVDSYVEDVMQDDDFDPNEASFKKNNQN